MPKIGDRYIIEIDDILKNTNKTECLYRIKGFNSLVFDQKGIDKLLKYDDCIKIDLAKAEKCGYEKGLAEDEIKIGDVVSYALMQEPCCGVVINTIGNSRYIILNYKGCINTMSKNEPSKAKEFSYPIEEMMTDMRTKLCQEESNV